jgi:serine/threonine protein kinase
MFCPRCNVDNDPGAETCFTCGKPLTAVIKRGTLVAGRYEVLSILGMGGMGTVYKGRDRVQHENVAIKVLRPDLSRRAEMERRFQSEMALARRVNHPNVCRILECGDHGGLLYVCMEFLEGSNLKRLLRGRNGFPTEQAFDLSTQLALGLQAIHNLGLVHRDIKTANVMVDPRGTAKLMDLDIAKQCGVEESSAVTISSQVVGSPEYISPEQARGRPVDVRSDVYSLGVVIYELFTGHVPFRGDTSVATVLKHLEEAPLLEGPGAERIPEGLVPVLRKALAKTPEKRYSSARGLAAALRLARTMASAPALPPTRAAEPLPALLQALNPTDATVRLEVQQFRGLDLDARRAIPVLIGALGEDRTPKPPPAQAPPPAPDPSVTTPDAVAVLIKALRTEDHHGRARAARALGGIGPAAKESIPVLLEALKDREATVRWDAARALGQMGAVATEALASAVRDPDLVVRGIVADALKKIIRRKRTLGAQD